MILKKIAAVMILLTAVSCVSGFTIPKRSNGLPLDLVISGDLSTKQFSSAIHQSWRKPLWQTAECQPDNVRRPGGVSAETDLTSLTAQPTTIDEFQEWINNLLGRQILVSRRPKNFYAEGDFNGDGCKDAAVIVEPDTEYAVVSRPDDPKVKPKTNRNFNEYVQSFIDCSTEVIDLENNFSAYPCENKSIARRLPPNSQTAVLIVNGGSQGWSWTVNGKGRTHLFLGVAANGAVGKSVTRLSVIRKNTGTADLKLPENAAGDGLSVITAVPKTSKRGSQTAGKTIYFNGRSYLAAQSQSAQ